MQDIFWSKVPLHGRIITVTHVQLYEEHGAWRKKYLKIKLSSSCTITHTGA